MAERDQSRCGVRGGGSKHGDSIGQRGKHPGDPMGPSPSSDDPGWPLDSQAGLAVDIAVLLADDVAVLGVAVVRGEVKGGTGHGVEAHDGVVVWGQRCRNAALTLTAVEATGLADLLSVLAEESVVDLDWGSVRGQYRLTHSTRSSWGSARVRTGALTRWGRYQVRPC